MADLGINITDMTLRGGCPAPFFSAALYPDNEGYLDGRLCQSPNGDTICCLPCPISNWVYPDSFDTLTDVANWISVVGTACCVFLLLSWACLPVENTNRHYLSICLTVAVIFMNLGFIVPLAARPSQCMNDITPHDMHSLPICGVSGSFLLFGGFAGVVWAFLRALSLHLQICWDIVVGRYFHFFAQAAGWGLPAIAIVASFVFSGVSFRFGATCHINHENSLAAFWIPILIIAGLAAVLQFTTFGYCIKVYLASLADNNTAGSSLPSTAGVSLTPRQAYRRIRRVIALQWRGITIVVIIIADVIFFSIVFVFQDVTTHAVRKDPSIAADWTVCLVQAQGDKNECLEEAGVLVVNKATILAVLLLLAINGIWLLFFLGRTTMFTGWVDLFKSIRSDRNNNDFVSVDARYENRQDNRAYEMLSRDSSAVVTPIDAVKLQVVPDKGRRAPDYFGQTATYHAPVRSFSNPSAPRDSPALASWDSATTYAPPRDHRGNSAFDDDGRPQGFTRM
ncbi:hypothetical protein ACRALDRAFT_1062782 [Sodiomyces alcalophilus JCM 7366]|uniref:uncharacterized protein n=1 Tax=Sodiomyces alcalophilus JCM 7366 TaxID=591952 RepID=UPI0039B3C0A3